MNMRKYEYLRQSLLRHKIFISLFQTASKDCSFSYVDCSPVFAKINSPTIADEKLTSFKYFLTTNIAFHLVVGI